MRLFVALPLPEELRDRLAALAHGIPTARWLPAENLHLTLRFIGEVDGRQARDVDAALAQLRMPCFPVVLAGIDYFGNSGKARALWVGVDPNPELERLQAKIEVAVQRAGLPPEGRKFKPHVTLARFKGNPGAKLQHFLTRNALFRGEPFEADEFVLYSSFLGRDGAIHTPEASYRLIAPDRLANASGSLAG